MVEVILDILFSILELCGDIWESRWYKKRKKQ